jgi:hypothetical protein
MWLPLRIWIFVLQLTCWQSTISTNTILPVELKFDDLQWFIVELSGNNIKELRNDYICVFFRQSYINNFMNDFLSNEKHSYLWSLLCFCLIADLIFLNI